MRPKSYRVPMPPKETVIDPTDLAVGFEGRRGVRVNMDLDESLLAEIGARGIATAVDNLGRHMVREYIAEKMPPICTEKWCMGIIESELRAIVREWTPEYVQELRDMYARIVQWQLNQPYDRD